MRSIFSVLTFFLAMTVNAQTTRTTVGTVSTINNMNKAGQFGAGIQVGSLSGVTLDYWHNSSASWNLGILANYGNTVVEAGHQWYLTNAFSGGANILVPYIGIGALAAFGDRGDYFRDVETRTTAVAAQMPLGVELLPSRQRFGVFGELRPTLVVSPASFGFLAADVGGRFYF